VTIHGHANSGGLTNVSYKKYGAEKKQLSPCRRHCHKWQCLSNKAS